jgi:hypothetical protein
MTETLYTVLNTVALTGWLALIFAPRWKWTTALLTSVVLPLLLGLAYIALLAANPDALINSGGFLHLTDVQGLFKNPYCLLAGWAHYLAFDLFVGSWQVRDSAKVGLPHWLVVPCLLLTFLLGPTGLVCYFVLRWSLARRVAIDA